MDHIRKWSRDCYLNSVNISEYQLWQAHPTLYVLSTVVSASEFLWLYDIFFSHKINFGLGCISKEPSEVLLFPPFSTSTIWRSLKKKSNNYSVKTGSRKTNWVPWSNILLDENCSHFPGPAQESQELPVSAHTAPPELWCTAKQSSSQSNQTTSLPVMKNTVFDVSPDLC